jgi:hypothetical protein
MTEIHPSSAQRPRTSLNGGTDALGPAIAGRVNFGGTKFRRMNFGGADGFDSCVG